MDKRKAINIAKKFSNEAQKVIPVEKIILFGSYAKNNFNNDSDIDIALIVKDNNYNFFKTYSKLSQICREIDTRIEPIIIGNKNDFSGFLETILFEGIVIYNAA